MSDVIVIICPVLVEYNLDSSFLGCDTVSLGKQFPMFRRHCNPLRLREPLTQHRVLSHNTRFLNKPWENLTSCTHIHHTYYTVKVSVGFLSHSKWDFMILFNSWIKHLMLYMHTCKKLACNHLISVHIQSNITTQKQYIVKLVFTPLSITEVKVMYTSEVMEFLRACLFQRDSQLVIQTARCGSTHLSQKSDVIQFKILTASFSITTFSTAYINIE